MTVVDSTEKVALTLDADIEFAAPISDAVDENSQIPHAFDMKTIEEAQLNDENISRVLACKQNNTPFDLEIEENITPFLRTLIQLYDQL